MASHRIPVLVWQDFEGFHTAAPVEWYLGDSNAVAMDATSAAAKDHLRAYLEWFYKRFCWAQAPDFLDPQLIQMRVRVRPQYLASDRIYPCAEEIELRIACVSGAQESGLLLCSLPTLGIGFQHYEKSELRPLVLEGVRRELASMTPRQLSRHLAPRAVELDEVTIRLPASTRKTLPADGPPTLVRIAQPLARPDFRKRFAAAYQRNSEVSDLTRRLGPEKASVLLVGESGSGKTTVLVHAVRNLERRSEAAAASQLAKYRYWQTSAARLIAGMRYLGQWQERCETIVEELAGIDGVLCIESLLDLLLLGGQDATSGIAAFLLSYVQAGPLRLVVEATPAELDASRRMLPAFVEPFQVLRLRELPDGEARLAVAHAVAHRARETKITVEEQTAGTVFRLFRRFMPYRPLPGGATGFLGELFESAQADRIEQIPVVRVLERFTRQTGLPKWLIRDDQPRPADEMQRAFGEQIIGQEDACRTMADMVATFKAGMNDPLRPLGTVLFCGPTGVGKTQLAKAVSQYLFGHGHDQDRLFRLDMSEYSSPRAADRLITQDSGLPSEFINRVRQQPFVVILLDEIEKAAPQVFDLLLGMLDEGRLTDRFGRTTTFRSTIIIMTSNLGTSQGSSLGFGPQSRDVYDKEVQAFFRPEFYNRLDAVVSFRPLDPSVCLAITRKELGEISRREGLAKAGLRLEYTDALVQQLVQEGFDRQYGARPLQRTVEMRVVAPVSRFIVEHPHMRHAVLHVDVNEQRQVTIHADGVDPSSVDVESP